MTATPPDRPESPAPSAPGTGAVQVTPDGQVRIDVTAWLTARTHGRLDPLTHDLLSHPQTGVADPADDAPTGTASWPDRARDWLRDRHDCTVADDDVIRHESARLAHRVWVVRAAAAGHGPLAVVGVDDQPPAVFRDACAQSWDWYDGDSVQITCPAGHSWTWLTGRELLTPDGRFTTLSAVFRSNLDAPFTPCPDCAAHTSGLRADPCGCDGTPWIICPACGARCTLTQPTPSNSSRSRSGAEGEAASN